MTIKIVDQGARRPLSFCELPIGQVFRSTRTGLISIKTGAETSYCFSMQLAGEWLDPTAVCVPITAELRIIS